ncbi:MAG: hypothetical protein GJ680_02820 [Alteromonadaceae bacterium]|nr:hypothetical protein [Alteromonadaceae bacterium]
MRKFKTKLGLAVASAVFSLNISAAETVTGNASVTVLNSFTLAETQALSFGTLVAIADDLGSNVATATIAASDGEVTYTSAGEASLTEVSAGQVGIFTITGAAPNTEIDITTPSSAATLSDPSNSDTKDFTLNGFTTSVVTSGTAFTFDTDSTGTLVFNLGATLTTDATLGGSSSSAVAYGDATYTGTFTIAADY